jgi:hypothetical protein
MYQQEVLLLENFLLVSLLVVQL